jgi:hypothetical protein
MTTTITADGCRLTDGRTTWARFALVPYCTETWMREPNAWLLQEQDGRGPTGAGTDHGRYASREAALERSRELRDQAAARRLAA